MKDELVALLTRIRSENSRKAGDAFFSADPLDLSVAYSPDNFDRPDIQPDSKPIDFTCTQE